MKKKMVSWLLATAMVMSGLPASVWASDFEDEAVWSITSEEQASIDTQEDSGSEPEEDSAQEYMDVVQTESELETEPEEVSETEEGSEASEEILELTTVQEEELEEPEIPEAADVFSEGDAENTGFDDFADFVAEAGSEEAVEGYVLMNIPYSAFYQAEGTVDVISAATAKKRSNTGLAGGSYHLGEEGTDITGVIFPVKLAEGVDLTSDESYVKADTADALFAGSSYTYAAMNTIPAVYKELNVDGSFGPVQGTRTNVEASVSLKLTDKHADDVLEVEGLSLGESENVSGVVLETSDGNVYGLRHVNNIWRKYELGWNKSDASYASLTGRTIQKITYL